MLECLVEEWVIKHPRVLGFDRIEKIPESYGRYHTSTYGDCLGYKDESVKRIEIETDISGFFLHSPQVRQRIAIVISEDLHGFNDKWKEEELAKKQVINLFTIPQFQRYRTNYYKKELTAIRNRLK